MKTSKKRLLALTLAVFLLLTLLCACKTDTSNRVIYCGLESDPVNLDPQLAQGESALTIVGNVFEGLLRTTPGGEIVNGVAEEWKVSKSGQKYTFTLKPDLFWSNRTPLTAEDFVFALQRAVDPQTRAPDAYLLSGIKNASKIMNGELASEKLSVKAPDPSTVVIELKEPDSNFLFTLTRAVCMPCNQKIFEKAKGKYGLSDETVMSNGPFKVSSWVRDDVVRIEQNAEYHDYEQVVPHEVVFTFSGQGERIIPQITGGLLDISAIDGSQVAEIEQENNKNLRTVSLDDTIVALCFNVKSEPFGNTSARRSLALSINRDQINATLPDYLAGANALIPRCYMLDGECYRDEVDGDLVYPFDVERAKVDFSVSLSDLGIQKYPATKLIYPESAVYEGIVRQMIEGWQMNLGVFVNPEPLPQTQLEAALIDGDFDIALVELTSKTTAPLSLLMEFNSKGANIANYKSSSFDKLLKKIKAADDGSADDILAAEKHLIDNAVAVPLLFRPSNYVVSKVIWDVDIRPVSPRMDFRLTRKE